MTTDRIRQDFDRLASLGDRSDSGSNRYDSYLLSLVPASAARILDVGCGVGRLADRLARDDRFVVAVDLSPGMVARARAAAEHPGRMHFICGDFLDMQFEQSEFDCVVSAATLHHMPGDTALTKIGTLVRPGGRVIIHDIRHGSGIVDTLGMGAILGYESARRLLTTGWPLSPRRVRQAWKDHAAGDRYVTVPEAEELFERHLPGTRVHRHWGWRYTAIWDRPAATDW